MNRILVAVLVPLIVITGVNGVAQADPSDWQQTPRLGPVIISPEMGDWHDYQLPLFRAGGFDFVKVHIAPGFDTAPAHVMDLIESGAEVVMLKTEDCRVDAATTRHHLVDRGFLDLIDQYPEISFVMQVGNEPERCPMPMADYVDGLVEVAIDLRPEVDRPNLEWVAGLPMVPSTTRALIDAGYIQELYDGLGTNMLGHFSLLDERHGWHEIVDYVLEESDADLWITELGINHPPMSKTEKARRMKAYFDQLPADRVRGVSLFALALGSPWPQYEFTEAMVPVFSEREECRYFVATDQWLCDGFYAYWTQYGGLPIFGFPVTTEYRDETGRNVQYFERARFEWHPGVWPQQHDVLLGHLGVELIGDRWHEPPFVESRENPAPGEECVYFLQTRQHLCGAFLRYWNEFGGLPIFGYPLSREFTEGGHTVQYFERTRLEYHPGVWPERHDVLQGLLGVQAVQDRSLAPDGDLGP